MNATAPISRGQREYFRLVQNAEIMFHRLFQAGSSNRKVHRLLIVVLIHQRIDHRTCKRISAANTIHQSNQIILSKCGRVSLCVVQHARPGIFAGRDASTQRNRRFFAAKTATYFLCHANVSSSIQFAVFHIRILGMDPKDVRCVRLICDAHVHMENKSIKCTDRLFDIIEALSNHPRGISLAALSLEVDLHKSTVHRFLATLLSKGYVVKDGETTRYRLTMRMFEIGSRVLGGANILSIARPILENLADETDEAVHMVVRDGNEIVYIYKEESSNSMIRMSSKVGLRSPMDCTGLGKAIMAMLPENEAQNIWNQTEIIQHTEKTITNYQRMQLEMAHIRQCGYAMDNEEHERGVRCIAAPIFDFSRNPIAAISVSAPATRLDDSQIERIASLVMGAAANISSMQGMEPST